MQYWNSTTAEANVAYFLSASQGLGAFCNIKYQSFTKIKSSKYFFPRGRIDFCKWSLVQVV